jgi:hypothetical protein
MRDKHCAFSNSSYISYYRYLMEDKIGRKLGIDEVVHHINLNHADNRIENLRIMSRSEHGKLQYLCGKPTLFRCGMDSTTKIYH